MGRLSVGCYKWVRTGMSETEALSRWILDQRVTTMQSLGKLLVHISMAINSSSRDRS